MKFKFIVLILLIMLSTQAALAVGEVTFDDLETGEPAILTGNPAHVFKTWFQGLKSLFATDRVEKLENSQSALSERAAEVKKVSELISDNRDVMSKALSSYEETLGDFTKALKKIEPSDLSDEKLSQTLKQLLVHLRLTDDLGAVLTRNRDLDLLEKIQESIASNIIWISEEVEAPKKLTERLARLYEEDGFIDLRLAEITDLILNQAEDKSLRLELIDLKFDFLGEFTNWLSQEIKKDSQAVLKELQKLAGSAAQRIASLDYLSAYLPITITIGK